MCRHIHIYYTQRRRNDFESGWASPGKSRWSVVISKTKTKESNAKSGWARPTQLKKKVVLSDFTYAGEVLYVCWRFTYAGEVLYVCWRFTYAGDFTYAGATLRPLGRFAPLLCPLTNPGYTTVTDIAKGTVNAEISMWNEECSAFPQ